MADLKTTLALDDKRFRTGLDSAARTSDAYGKRIGRALNVGGEIIRAFVTIESVKRGVRFLADATRDYATRNEAVAESFGRMHDAWERFRISYGRDIAAATFATDDFAKGLDGTSAILERMRDNATAFFTLFTGGWDPTRGRDVRKAMEEGEWQQDRERANEGFQRFYRMMDAETAALQGRRFDAERRRFEQEKIDKRAEILRQATEEKWSEWQRERALTEFDIWVKAKEWDIQRREREAQQRTTTGRGYTPAIEGDALITAARRTQIFGTADFIRPKPDERAYRQRDKTNDLLQKVQNAIERWNIGYAP